MKNRQQTKFCLMRLPVAARCIKIHKTNLYLGLFFRLYCWIYFFYFYLGLFLDFIAEYSFLLSRKKALCCEWGFFAQFFLSLLAVKGHFSPLNVTFHGILWIREYHKKYFQHLTMFLISTWWGGSKNMQELSSQYDVFWYQKISHYSRQSNGTCLLCFVLPSKSFYGN